ncbi:helix-turn-helix transcriptional regulator [Streptomyces sp. SM14]|uniref:helix-turn-helix transcriptional regulator n=1 Tax=Streptomyces sp. SM14 TaxID=1736045 RepID=UPI002155FF31|nr:helix-turn-helix transcriptional regulator [Streptomyces sp. SM14]
MFVGRSGELTALREGLTRARRGEPQAYVVGGEAGVGKSRLLEEFTAHARAAGVTTAVGGCVELGADGLPFAPVAAVLRSLHRQLGPALPQAAAGQEDELARLLPELGEAGHAPPGEVDRALLFEFTTRLLERLAADRPLLVAVEDLHWSDRSTRELLGYLFRSVHRSRLLVVVTYRTDDIHRRHPLRPFLAELDRLRSVQRIELARLSRSEVSAQMAGIQGAPPEPAQLRSVFSRSEGNPFFVEELTAGGSSGDISDSLRDLLLVRMEALPEDTQEILRIVAEGGSSVEHALLAEVARCPEGELLTALRTAVGGNLLVPTDDGDGYRFRHALMREAVIDDLLPGERARLNRRYAEALEESGHVVPVHQLAARKASYWHLAGEPTRALPAVLDAAVQARRRYAFAEQLRLLERALELWDGVPKEIRRELRPVDHIENFPVTDTEQPLRFRDLLAEAMHAAVQSGQPDRGWAISKQALRLLDEQEDPLRAAWFWVNRSRTREQLGRGDGLEELERARSLIAGLPPSIGHAHVLASVASWQNVNRPGPESFGHAERAVEMARVTGAVAIELHARFTLASLKADSGDVDGGLADMRAVRDQMLRRELPPSISGIGRAMVNFAGALFRFGWLTEACTAAEEGLELCDRFGLSETKPWLQSVRAGVLDLLGDWDAAEEAIQYCWQAVSEPRARAAARARIGLMWLRRGDADAAERALEETRVLLDVPAVPAQQFRLPEIWLAIELAAARGRITEVREHFVRATSEEFPPFMAAQLWQILPVVAGIEADARGVPEAAEGRAEALRRIREVAGRMPTVVEPWAAGELHWRAEQLRAEGRDSPEAWQRAIDALVALRDTPVPALAWARRRYAEAVVASGGSRRSAEEALRLARATAVRLRAKPLVEEIDQLAKRARLDLGAGGSGRNGRDAESGLAVSMGLTARERDVLALVAAGRSNRQIAEALYIAPKTASVHVSNILAKLEVSSRGEAAALAHRLRLVPVATD